MKAAIHNIYALAVLLFAGLWSCQSDEALPREEVQLLVMLEDEETTTRANVAGTAFEANDKFRFFFNSAVPEGVHTDPANVTGTDLTLKKTDYTFSSNKWSTTNPIYWDDHETIANRKFCGIMPFDANYNTTVHTFTVQTDQSAVANYKASDLLIARTETNKRLIPLNFWHALSRVVVNVSASIDTNDPDNCFEKTALDNMTIAINQVLPVAKIDYTGSITPGNNYNPSITVAANGASANVKMLQTKAPTENTTKKTMETTHVAVIPPQTITADTRVLIITLLDGSQKKNYYFQHNAATDFVQHKQTEINVTLHKTNVEVTANVTIEPWGNITAEGGGTIVLPPKQP